MKQEVTFSAFTDAFRAHGRKDQFSYEALRVLFDWFEETDPETELDVIGICCEFSEETWQEIAEYCSIDLTDCDDDADCKGAVLKHLENNTLVCGMTDRTIIYQQF